MCGLSFRTRSSGGRSPEPPEPRACRPTPDPQPTVRRASTSSIIIDEKPHVLQLPSPSPPSPTPPTYQRDAQTQKITASKRSKSKKSYLISINPAMPCAPLAAIYHARIEKELRRDVRQAYHDILRSEKTGRRNVMEENDDDLREEMRDAMLFTNSQNTSTRKRSRGVRQRRKDVRSSSTQLQPQGRLNIGRNESQVKAEKAVVVNLAEYELDDA